LINGVSFKKGCYPGQEIVARLHYLGTPSRRMFQAQVDTANLVKVGDEVTSDTGDIAGHVVRVQRKDNDILQMLLSLKLSAVKLGVFVHNNEQVTIIDSNIVE
jgi:folate-binding Fe-S cluster repair protein YgfZ